MSNRHKPLSARAQATARAVVVLAQRPGRRNQPIAHQIQLICTSGSVAEVQARLEPDSVALMLYHHCLHGRTVAEQRRARKTLQALAHHAPTLLTRPELVPAVAAITRLYYYRRRELAEWQPQRRNAYRQLYSLIRHLFDEFGDVPGWVLEAWATGQLIQSGVDMARLTVRLGSGGALRTFPGLPVPLTRRLEHAMRQAPWQYTFVQALRYAQLTQRNALALLEPVLASPLGREIGPEDAFWLGVAELFRAAPHADAWKFWAVCEWIQVRRTIGTDGEPPQPGFSLKGRSVAGLLAQAGHWYRRTRRARCYWGYRLALNTSWAGLPIPNFTPAENSPVQIVQLLSYAELVEEGSAQKHCVSSYVYGCLRGRCGIFSLRHHGARLLTLEVRANRRIVQIRGRTNRRVTEPERAWLAQWATEAGLSLSTTA